MVLFGAVIAAAGLLKKEVRSKKGTEVLSKALLASVLVLAAAIALFLVMKTIMCKTGTWTGGVCGK